ncbi:hypothetical protein GDO81_003098 [Engystomops pustulosus]|uniref:UPAR/Ly6 domain-containing protein n=1 Tax=Engystomops pustulosus TaxID=76066 RepID=A0AAV6ZUX7_ENGPU|nr:hypothetical protein GDO81_003098 [Engystomops pustulosus]
MVLNLLLCLLAIACFPGQTQAQKECHACQLKLSSICYLTTSYTAQCQENSNCGITYYSIGGSVAFTRYGCFETQICNTTAQGSGALKALSANTTCCITNYCNGGFTARAPHFAVIGLLSVFLLYITS